MHVQQRHMRERRKNDLPRGDRDRADAEPDEQRDDQEGDGAERPGGSHAASANPRLNRRCDHDDCRATFAIARAKSMIRGPQRDAMLSSTAITRCFFTAETFDQPGRAATVFGDCPQHTSSASTTMSGLAEMMYSGESCG